MLYKGQEISRKPQAASVFILSIILSGCIVRTYPLTVDRTDQDLNLGNRGYINGQAPVQDKERKTTRTTQALEIELRSPIKFERLKQPAQKVQLNTVKDQGVWGNQGYITQSEPAQIMEPADIMAAQKYTVNKNDTLQKISKKFYGTSKKWMEIYEANKDQLKGPDRLYPGQVLSIPDASGETLKETTENLK
jgi:LysM repeat protein